MSDNKTQMRNLIYKNEFRKNRKFKLIKNLIQIKFKKNSFLLYMI